MKSQIIAVSLLLLLLSTGIESYRIHKREAPTYLSQVQDAVSYSWLQVSNKAQDWFEAVRNHQVEEKAKEIFDKGTSAVKPYYNIFSDQLYHWWHAQ
ncbi:apolipoprotein C-II [Xenopus laevis]|uniref:Apolipoprotein C-II n=2 Tax=Xenopus laevis TaxID=8355 RepID=A0A1L8FNA2_XENLA|nr:apolipoprotein C-II [Xenopus laevis]XP_018082199.1 apolipoprotein C-II [Xenopus laevis]XP_041425524.1 apolipoprotein C-II [Xenopus laevis]OCT73048.1 hypothetical protein XELAEV_18036027mg [Xenopus laevis]